jgi:septal ring factor EnvC (AmiA/AmiB activator)
MIDFNTLMEIAGAALLSGALCACFFVSFSLRRWRTRCLALESNVAAMRREMETLASISLRTRRRVKRIEHEYASVADRVDSVEQRGSAASFDQAIDSARRGTDPGRLTQQFGLSRVEADLVTRLHGAKRTA